MSPPWRVKSSVLQNFIHRYMHTELPYGRRCRRLEHGEAVFNSPSGAWLRRNRSPKRGISPYATQNGTRPKLLHRKGACNQDSLFAMDTTMYREAHVLPGSTGKSAAFLANRGWLPGRAIEAVSRGVLAKVRLRRSESAGAAGEKHRASSIGDQESKSAER